MWLKCNQCGNVYNSPNRSLGGRCGVNNCSGTLVYFPFMSRAATSNANLDLQCKTCGNVYSSTATGKKIFDRCGVGGCNGVLDRYWG